MKYIPLTYIVTPTNAQTNTDIDFSVGVLLEDKMHTTHSGSEGR